MAEKIYRCAVISDGVVENVVLCDIDFAISGKTLIKLAEVDENGIDSVRVFDPEKPIPNIGWAYDGVDFTAPADIELPSDALQEYLDDLASDAVRQGIIWEGESISIGKDDQTFFSEIRIRALQYPDETATYKTKTKKYIKKSLKDFLPLAEAVYQHVQKCLSAEAVVSEKIDEGELKTRNQVQEEFNTQVS